MTEKKPRKRSHPAQYFDSFRDAFLAWMDRADGRHIYQVTGSPEGPFILASTELQAIRCLVNMNGSPVKRLSRKDAHQRVVQMLREAGQSATPSD